MTAKKLFEHLTQIRATVKNSAAGMADTQNNIIDGINAKKSKNIKKPFPKVFFTFIGMIFLIMIIQSYLPRTFKNTTKSVPPGIYREVRNVQIHINDIVAFPVDTIDFPFGSKPDCFLKVVGGLPNDYLRITDDIITVNGAVLVVNPFPKTDFNLTPFYYNGTIPDGYAFLYTAHSNSYDSRYFGFIPISKLIKTNKEEVE